MDEGAFDQNFTWFEWSFVSPDEVPRPEPPTPHDPTPHAATLAMQVLKQWDEEHQWQT